MKQRIRKILNFDLFWGKYGFQDLPAAICGNLRKKLFEDQEWICPWPVWSQRCPPQKPLLLLLGKKESTSTFPYNGQQASRPVSPLQVPFQQNCKAKTLATMDHWLRSQLPSPHLLLQPPGVGQRFPTSWTREKGTKLHNLCEANIE